MLRIYRCLLLLLSVVCATLVTSGCSQGSNEAAFQQIIPPIPSNTDFGSIYPRLNELLNVEHPDVHAAVQATRDWAARNIPDFAQAACARTQVVYDHEFAQMFGPFTLGVTLPWMQIYLRDGRRGEESFVWGDASLFVGTILHEYVHALQRARQAQRYLVESDTGCETARNALSAKRGVWNTGFSILKSNRSLGDAFEANDKALLYRWISPIERARDELEASVLTVRWMAQFPNELNVMTMGGATNWAYGAQYLDILKTLASSRCFSSDDDTFAEEQRIYNEEIPKFAAELAQYEEAMAFFLNQHGRELAIKEPILSLVVPAAPRGREGHGCVGLDQQLPRYPFSKVKTRPASPNDSLRFCPHQLPIN